MNENQAFTPSPTPARMKPVPQGVYVMLPRNELPADHPLLGNPAFGGFRLFANWKDLQPEPNRIDLTIIAEAAERVRPHKQKLVVSINFGKGAGEWVYNEPHPCTKFPFTMKGKPAVMPLGFEEAYQRRVNDFLPQLAQLCDKDEAISGLVMTGAGTLGIEFHVVELQEDIDAWEAAAQAQGFADRHVAIQTSAIYRIDRWSAQFKATTLYFCLGNPWSNQTGKADEQAVSDHAISAPNRGICSEFLKANSAYDETRGLVLAYPYIEEPVAPASSDDFYQGYEKPYPESPEPVHALLMTAYGKGATMCELWEEDALTETNHETIAKDAEKLVANVP